jgi:hypothetical protein
MRRARLRGIAVVFHLHNFGYADPEPKYVTFINPQPSKGMTVFARIAVVLNGRRPDIPLLVVEGRSGQSGLDLPR